MTVKRGLILFLVGAALIAGAVAASAQPGRTSRAQPRATAARTTIAAATAPARAPATADESPAARACGEMPAYTAATAAEDSEIMAGKVMLSPFPVATIDPHRDGDVDWSANPFNDPTWVASFQSGEWMESLVAGYLARVPEAAAYQRRAKALTQSWLKGVPIQDRDPATVICMSEAFPGQTWFNSQITVAVGYYAAHWMGAWNHGLKQDLELLRIGCAYPAGAFGGSARSWRQSAYQQMLAQFAPNRLGPAVDAQGVTNEQSTGYASFVYYLWTEAEHKLAACGYHLPSWITARIANRRLPPRRAAKSGAPNW